MVMAGQIRRYNLPQTVDGYDVVEVRIEIDQNFERIPLYRMQDYGPTAYIGGPSTTEITVTRTIRGDIKIDPDGRIIGQSGEAVMDELGNFGPMGDPDEGLLRQIERHTAQIKDIHKMHNRIKDDLNKQLEELKKSSEMHKKKAEAIDFIFRASSEGTPERAFMEALLDEDPCVVAAIEKYQGKSDG